METGATTAKIPSILALFVDNFRQRGGNPYFADHLARIWDEYLTVSPAKAMQTITDLIADYKVTGKRAEEQEQGEYRLYVATLSTIQDILATESEQVQVVSYAER